MAHMCLGSRKAGSHMRSVPYSSGVMVQILTPRRGTPTAKNGLARQRTLSQSSWLLKRLELVREETEEQETTQKYAQGSPEVSG